MGTNYIVRLSFSTQKKPYPYRPLSQKRGPPLYLQSFGWGTLKNHRIVQDLDGRFTKNGNICPCDIRVIVRSHKPLTVGVWHRSVFKHTWHRLRSESKSLSYAFSQLLIPPSIYTSKTQKLVSRPRKSLPSDRNFSYGSTET